MEKTIFQKCSEVLQLGSLSAVQKADRIRRWYKDGYITFTEQFHLTKFIGENKALGPISVGGCRGER